MNRVGVPRTSPEASPLATSRRTRPRTPAPVRSWSKRARSSSSSAAHCRSPADPYRRDVRKLAIRFALAALATASVGSKGAHMSDVARNAGSSTVVLVHAGSTSTRAVRAPPSIAASISSCANPETSTSTPSRSRRSSAESRRTCSPSADSGRGADPLRCTSLPVSAGFQPSNQIAVGSDLWRGERYGHR